MVSRRDFYSDEHWNNFLEFSQSLPTPCIVINLDVIKQKYEELRAYFPYAKVYYAVKANPAAEIIELLRDAGSYFDIASIYELDKVLSLGVAPEKLSYGNTIKKAKDIEYSYERGVRLFVTDCEADLYNISKYAPGSQVYVRILFQGAETADWPLSRKFGCTSNEAIRLITKAKELNLDIYGISFHVGSQQRDIRQWSEALAQVEHIFYSLQKQGIKLKMINMGGGFPAKYLQKASNISEYASEITRYLKDYFGENLPEIMLETGRSIVGDAGILISEIITIAKNKNDDTHRWVYVDAGKYNGLIETIDESIKYPVVTATENDEEKGNVILAGPTCDSYDIMYEKTKYQLPLNLGLGERLYWLTTGAYTTSFASIEFNGFPPIKAYFMGSSNPLSLNQQALWFLYQMAPESVAYNIFIAIRIRSNLNITALERACQQILDRHPILRTTYKARSGKPFQQIHSRQEVSLRVTDASNGSEDYLKEQILLETDRPFNLEKEPVLRLNLFTRSGQEHILLLTMHHMAGDFWSFDLLLNELQVWYAVETKQVGPQQIEDFLPKNLPYTEFVHWQSEMLSSPRGEKLWEYWQKQLSGELPILNLPTDRPRPPVQNYRGETHIFQLDEQLIQGLRSVAISTETSIEKLMLAAFFVWLYRYTNQEDILLGSRMAGRCGREEFKGIVGYFVNPVVLRTDISGNKTFKDFLAQVSSQVKEAQNHQDYPFPLLVEKLQPQGEPSLSPLFQVSFTWQKQRWCESLKKSSRFQEPGLEMEPYPLGHQRGASVDLDVMVMEMGDVIQAGWQYNTDLFDEATIARMAGHFQTMLSGIVANPEQPISELPLLTETERHQLLVEWNNTSAEYPQNKCIHQLFEEQVERSPSSVAVVFEGEQLTYLELNARANQLAHHLRELGVGPEVLVGICVERSFEMIVGILGVLKAGGAYVPLDPAYPSERLAFMLEDSSVPVLLTQSKLIEKLPPHSARVVCLDGDIKEIARHSQENPSSTVTPDNLAYVIYTSGSTGKPKGVLLAHCGLCNLATAQIQLFDVQPKSRVLQFASFSFDASVSEVFMAIVPGATLVLAKGDSLMPGPALIGLLRDCAITTVTLPPSVLAVLPAEEFPALQTIIVAGEACPPDVVARWEPGHQFFNAYGPTESTVCATVALCSDGSQKPLIGCPINNTKIYILDAQNQPVPIGVPGELHIAGVGLARGYLNRPELTEQKFIPSPFSDDPGIRLYKTGDLARYLPDGNVEYLGRIDNQVKIRGFRIELGEIDAVLTQHPDILSAAVIDREDTPGNKRLVAYVVSNLIPDRVPYHTECQLELDGNAIKLHTEDISTGGVAVVGVPDIDEGRRVRLHLQLPGESFPRWLSGTVAWSRPPQAGIQFQLAPSEQALVDQSAAYQLDTLNLWKTLQRTLSGSLRDYLKQKLPDYMIPSAFVLMKALPLTPNGKVDRRALRAPDSFHKELKDKFVAPRTPIEVKLAAIWAEVLGVQEVGINDNFFELGGHSLIATQIISRIRQAFAIELPLRHLFEASTIASLGKVIETACTAVSQEPSSYSTASDSLPPLAPATRKGYIPLSKAQEHIWYVQQLNPDSCICNTRKALRFTGKLSSEALERSLNEIIRRHEIMRTTFPVVDGQPVQAIAPELTLPLKIVDLQNIPSAKREAKAVHFSQREMNYHFDLANGPLIKATLVRLSSEEHWLLIPIHHIITDGWSIDLFVQELETLYTAFSNGLPSPLPEVALHYADFTLWQRQCLNEEVLARQLDYWVQKLTAPLELPEYRPERESKPNPKSGCASSYSLVLKQNLVASLKYLSRSHRVTTSTIIIAGLILLLFKYYEQSEIMIVATIGNRSTPEIDKMLGCFINQVILRTQLDDEQTGAALLEQVQETLNEAISNKDIPLEQVIEAVKRQRKVTLYADVTIVPPVEVSDPMFVSEIAPDSGSGELWDSEIPLEFYISSPSGDSQTIEFWFLYSTDVFASETIDRLFSYYQEILQKLADSPEMKIASFEGFPEKNREGAQ